MIFVLISAELKVETRYRKAILHYSNTPVKSIRINSWLKKSLRFGFNGLYLTPMNVNLSRMLDNNWWWHRGYLFSGLLIGHLK